MNHYELLVLTPGSLQDPDVEKVKDEVTNLIKENGGSVTSAELWGRKRLAYPIANERHGVYTLIEFDGEATRLIDITRKLKLNAKVLRHLLLTKKPISEREREMQEAAAKRAHARVAREATAVREQTTKAAQAKAAESGTPQAPKITLEELDKKLDEILDQDILK